MKCVVICLVLLSGLLSTAQGEETKIGTCLLVDYAQKVYSCHTKFIHSLQKNPQADCSVDLQSLIDCTAKSVASCFPSMNEAAMKDVMQKTLTKDLMCDRAGLQAPVPAGLSPGQKICNTTYHVYINKLNACAEKMVKMGQANRADKGLCTEYDNVKRCQIDIAKTDLACLQKRLNNTLDQYFGPHRNFNPFCYKTPMPSNAIIGANPSYIFLIGLAFSAMAVFLKF